METLILPFLNLSLLCGLLFYLLRKPATAFIQGRHDQIRTDVEEARNLLRQSRERLDDTTSRLNALDAEVASIQQQAQRDAEEMKAQISRSAKEATSSMIADAREGAQVMAQDLRREIQKELGFTVVAQAEGMVQKALTTAVHKKLRNEFSSNIGKTRTARR